MTRTAISIRVAVGILFDKGKTGDEVIKIIKSIKQPTPGYVYPDDIPGFYNL